MPPSPDFYSSPSKETLAAAEAWKKVELYRGINYACQITLTSGEKILGELAIERSRLGIGEISIPVKLSREIRGYKTPAELELFSGNQAFFGRVGGPANGFESLGLPMRGSGIHGEFLCFESAGIGRDSKDINSYLVFFRKHPKPGGRFRELTGIREREHEKTLLPISAQGLAVVFEKNFGWKVEPLAVKE